MAAAAALRSLGDALDAAEIERAIQLADFASIGRIIDSRNVQDILSSAYNPIAELYTDSAQREFDKYDGALHLDPLVLGMVVVPLRNEFVSNLSVTAKEVIKQQLIASLSSGVAVDDVASDLIQVIGLTPQQAKAVQNYRAALEAGDKTALGRKLRDARYDATVRSWASGEAEVEASKVDAMVERYAQRLLAYRAQTIARTESLKAASNGIRDAYKQSVESGRLLDSEVRRKWLTAADERVCPVCSTIPLINAGGISVLRPYLSIQGPIEAPPAHPRCRCVEKYTADLTRVTETPFPYQEAA